MVDKCEQLEEHHEDIIFLAEDAYRNIKMGLYTNAARHIQAIVELEQEFQRRQKGDEE